MIGLKKRHALAARGSANPSAIYQSKVLTDGAKYYWPLDDVSGTSAREVVLGQNATISPGVTLNQPGIAGGKSMKFDAFDDKVLTQTLTIPANHTIELWVNPSGSIARRIFSFRNEASYILDRLIAGTLQIFDGSFHVGTTVLTSGNWYHIVITISFPTLIIYVNGVVDNTFATSISGLTGALKLSFDPPDSTAFWDGFIQNVAIYPLVLTPTQISSHFALR